MNDIHSMTQPKPFFGPRDLLLNVVVCHILGLWLLAPFAFTALFLSHGHKVGAVACIAVFIWAWRSRVRWLPALAFLVVSVAFWLAVILPWWGYGRD